MAVAFDATITSLSTNAGQTTLSHTTSGSNRLLVVAVALYDASIWNVSSVAYKGVAMTSAGSQASPGGSFRVYVFYLVNPALGANNVVVNYNGFAPETVVTATSFTGVDQLAPVGTFVSANGGSNPVSLSVTSEPNGMVVDALAIAVSGITATVGSGQTQRWNQSGSVINSAGSTEPGAASVVMDWTLNGSVSWILAALPLKASTAMGMMMRSGS